MDDFPPLRGNANGDIGQERNPSVLAGPGFGSQASVSSMTKMPSSNRAGNGLLSALPATSRAADVRSPTGMQRQQDMRGATSEEDTRQKRREDSMASQPSLTLDGPLQIESRNPHGAIGGAIGSAIGSAVGSAIGSDAASSKGKDEQKSKATGREDPLADMAPVDRWGLKGLQALLQMYPESMRLGVSPNAYGLDLSSSQ